MVNATFDVYLEGPMGALWYWTVFGIGIAAAQIYRDHAAKLASNALSGAAKIKATAMAEATLS